MVSEKLQRKGYGFSAGNSNVKVALNVDKQSACAA